MNVESGPDRNGWAGFDDVMFFVDRDNCPLEPPDAKPSPPTTTEPPPGILSICFRLFQCSSHFQHNHNLADNLCNFEKDLCGWSNYAPSAFKWTRLRGQVGY